MAVVPRVPAEQLSADEFKLKYMLTNQPVILTHVPLLHTAAQWVTSPGGEVRTDVLRKHFADTTVPVTDVNALNSTREMLMTEFLDWWEAERPAGGKLLYLKDWTLAAQQPQYNAYVCPAHFQDDWLNAHWESRRQAAAARKAAKRAAAENPGDQSEGQEVEQEKEDVESEDERCASDHRFVYMGPRGSWTALHADVLRSFSWSFNVCGRKRWLLFPPKQDARPAARRVAGEGGDGQDDVDTERFPRVRLTAPLEVLQGPGEVLFVPSGWYHQVHNVEDTISINHNWLNAANAHEGWALLRRTLEEVKAGLCDPDDLEDDVLLAQLLRRKTGMDMEEFAELVHTGACGELRRCAEAVPRCCSSSSSSSSAADDRRRCDLETLRRTQTLMREVEEQLPAVLWMEQLTWADTRQALAEATARLQPAE